MRGREVSMKLPEYGQGVSHVPHIPPLAWVEVSISLVKDMHSQNPPIVPETRCRINSLVAI